MTMEKTERRKRRRDGSSTPPPRTLKQYSVEEKLDIIDYAKSTGNRAAGREFNVAESSIREWRKHEVKLRGALASGGGAKAANVSTPNSRQSTFLSLLPTISPLPSTTVSSSSSSSPSSDISTTSSSISVDSEVSGSRKRKATAPRKIVLDE